MFRKTDTVYTHSRGCVLYQRHLSIHHSLPGWGECPVYSRRWQGKKVRTPSSTRPLVRKARRKWLIKNTAAKARQERRFRPPALSRNVRKLQKEETTMDKNQYNKLRKLLLPAV